ncbi:hypothetical protein [Cellulosilyticum sp. I15G10I2]|uniref:hypothetical protein n=1 Tax=Cellulosilyticum sp. I15G10I2 TaxID=1892843 RepID=UPI00085CB58A|nr:hypothetical protein [Cellulosilyticum sp. I15G10I2]
MKFLDELKEKMNSRKSKINAQMQQVNELNEEIETLRAEIAAREAEYMDTLDINLLKVIDELKQKISFIEKNKDDRLRLLEGAKQKTYDIDWSTIENDIDKAVKASKAQDIMSRIKKTQEDYLNLLEEYGYAVEAIYDGYTDLVRNQQYMDINLQRKIARKYRNIAADNHHFTIKEINAVKEKHLIDHIKYKVRNSRTDFKELNKAEQEYSEITGISGSDFLDGIKPEHREFCEQRLNTFIKLLRSYSPNDPERIKLQEKIGKLQMLLGEE